MTKGKTQVKKNPTVLQRRAAKLYAENIRTKGKPKKLGNILREAGYSESVANSPEQITKGRTWNELLDEYLPEQKLVAKHTQLLEATKEATQLKAVELGYRIRNKLGTSEGFGESTELTAIVLRIRKILPE